jgi:hypothetical protein
VAAVAGASAFLAASAASATAGTAVALTSASAHASGKYMGRSLLDIVASWGSRISRWSIRFVRDALAFADLYQWL